jgi:predicted permease
MFPFAAELATTAPPASNASGSVEFVTLLVPAICQVFFVILLGYILGTTGAVSVQHAGPLAQICGTVLLPISVFTAMISLDVSPQAWQFLGGILIVKALTFALVIALVLATDRSMLRYGAAGVRAIFCTQSNDFAFGLPIFLAIFSSHTEYKSFLYVVAPISLVLLNPIGFMLMEITRHKMVAAASARLPIDDQAAAAAASTAASTTNTPTAGGVVTTGALPSAPAGAGGDSSSSSSSRSSTDGDSGVHPSSPIAVAPRNSGIVCQVVTKVARDPLVIMTFLGIICRLILIAANATLPTQVRCLAVAAVL